LIFVVDTYDTLNSGVPNAIKTFKELKNNLPKVYGVRLDSGDLAYLTKKIRIMLDDAGFESAIIVVSNNLDENIISSLKQQGVKANSWGIGTKLVSCSDIKSFGIVYKLVALENSDGIMVPKIKISDNVEKISTPCLKQIYRIYDKASKKIKLDLLGLYDEDVSFDYSEESKKFLTISNQVTPWKKLYLEEEKYSIRKLLCLVVSNGKKVQKKDLSAREIRNYCQSELDTLWDEYKRITNPEIMLVCLSDKLFDIKHNLLKFQYGK
jgi:nicotinate phosphoribosyltransferase